MAKSILFINRVYPPDYGATGQLLAELADALVQNGWKVSVVAAHQTGGDSQTSRAPADVSLPQPAVHRVRGLAFTRASNWQRALSYASLYPAILWRVLRLPRNEVVVTLTDPPLHLLLGPVIQFCKRSRLIHWAQDVYPEVAEELDVLRKGGLAARLLRSLSTWALRRHDTIIAVGACMKQRLLARGIDGEKITIISNWAVALKNSPPLPAHRNPQPFTVLYSGNFGLAHPFEGIVDAVKILEREGSQVRFIFAGAGAQRDSVCAQLAGCRNVEFRDPAPLDKLQQSLASADVHLACMKNELLGLVVPSKVYGALASARPCIFLGPDPSEAARLLISSGTGCVLDPMDGLGLAELLRRWSARGLEFSTVQTACETLARTDRYSIPLGHFISLFR